MNQSSRLLERFGAWSGVVFVIALFAAFTVVGDAVGPSPDDPAATIAAHLTEHATGNQLGTSLALVSVAALVVFACHLRDALRRAEPERTFLPAVALAGGILTATMILTLTSLSVASGVIGGYGDDTQVAKALYVLSWEFIVVFGPPLALLIGATSASALIHRSVPRWLGWSGLPIAVVLLTPAYYFAFLLAFPWLLALSLTLALRTIRLPAPSMQTRPA